MSREPSTRSASEGSEERLLFTPRRERPMTRAHAALWALILLTTAADVVLTTVGVAGELQEGNAVVGAMVSSFGLAGLWAVKFAAMCWLVAIVEFESVCTVDRTQSCGHPSNVFQILL